MFTIFDVFTAQCIKVFYLNKMCSLYKVTMSLLNTWITGYFYNVIMNFLERESFGYLGILWRDRNLVSLKISSLF